MRDKYLRSGGLRWREDAIAAEDAKRSSDRDSAAGERKETTDEVVKSGHAAK